MSLGPRVRERAGRVGTSGPVYERNRQYWVGGAPYSAWSLWSSGGDYYPFFERCEDIVSSPPHPDNNLNLQKCDLQVGYLSGVWQGPPPTSRQFRHTNTVLNPSSHGDFETGHLAPLSWSHPGDYINQALARANPNRSDINLAQSIFELREVPSMIKHLGDLLSKRGLSSAPISWQFGWAPLINDLKTLLNLSEAIDRRLAMLNRLYRKEQRERFTLKHETTSSTSKRSWVGFNYTYNRSTALDVWVVKKHLIKGTPLSPAKPFDRDSAFWQAISEGTIETLWAVLPWSWLVDYFVGIADFLAATSNRIPGYSVSSLCIMHKLETTMWHETTTPDSGWFGSCKLKPLKGVRTSKERLVLNNPTAVFPTLKIISDSQLGTLAALALALNGRMFSVSQ